MNSALVLQLAGEKLSSVPTVALAVAIIGGVIFLTGWFWLIFQSLRFSILYGIATIIPVGIGGVLGYWWILEPYQPIWEQAVIIIGSIICSLALIIAYGRLQHAQKIPLMALCLAGLVVAGLGGLIRWSAFACEQDDRCFPSADDEEAEDGVEQDESEDSALFRDIQRYIG